jgi:hypothetical protein
MPLDLLNSYSVINDLNSSILDQYSDFPSELGCLFNNSLLNSGLQKILLLTQPLSQSINENNPVTFRVTATGSGPLSYQWKFNNTNIDGAINNSYTIPSVQAINAGNYSVVVSNSLGSVTSNNAVLTVNTSPVITTQPQSQSVAVGVISRFNVVATGNPLPTYQWYFNNVLIPNATLPELDIEDSSTINDGTYYVVVSNVLSSVSSNNATLFVIYPNPSNPPNPPNPTDPCNDLYSCLYNQLYNQFYNQLYNQLYNQDYNQLYNQLYDALIYALFQPGPPAIIPIPSSSENIPDSQMTESNFDYIYDTLYDSMYDNLYDELYNQMFNNLFTNLYNKFSNLPYSDTSVLNINYQFVNTNDDIYGTLYNNIFNQIIKQLYSQLFTQLFNDLYEQLNQQIYG